MKLTKKQRIILKLLHAEGIRYVAASKLGNEMIFKDKPIRGVDGDWEDTLDSDFLPFCLELGIVHEDDKEPLNITKALGMGEE